MYPKVQSKYFFKYYAGGWGGGCASPLNVQKYGMSGAEDISFSI